jgi:inosine-uridine nucleoside N-ribohydrolase
LNKLILDVDTGEDDAIAIALAIRNNLPLTHIVTSYGNTTLESATKNTANILHLANATSVQVVKGSKKPLNNHPFETSTAMAGDFVGKNGICGLELEPNSTISVQEPVEGSFEVYIERVLKKNKKSDYIVTGPQTNLARICQYLGKDIGNYIDRVYVMGAAVHATGNSGPKDENGAQKAEFNIYCDPHAADVVLHSGLRLHYVTWDACKDITIPYDTVQQFQSTTTVGNFAVTLMKKFLESYGIDHGRNFELCDPMTILAYMGYGEFEDISISINTDKSQYGAVEEDDQGISVKQYRISETDKEKAIATLLKSFTIISL